jgi:hypothetical protein
MAKKKMARVAGRRRRSTADSEPDTPAVPEFPKTMVKVARNPGGGFDISEQKVEDAEAEAAAVDNGFHPLEEVVTEPEIQEYPAWRYHPKQGARLVQSEAEDDKLGDDWTDSPAPAEEPEATTAKAKE